MKHISLLVSLGIIFSLTQFGAAKDITAPGQFELLLPESNATTYASVYGDTPIMAWRAGSDSIFGIDHYEVWLDGVNVDNIDAGLYGHLPGGKYGNYEPFRPFGFLAAEKVYYYTPLVSKVSAGSHKWYVIAVDKDGNKRRSNSVFKFKVEDFSTAKIFVNHLGYLLGDNNRVVVDASVKASSFDVVDLNGKVVFSGDLKSGRGAFGNNLFGDFTVGGVSGTYRIKAGSEYSMWFPVGLGAKLNYESYLRKYRNAYTRKRCGDTTVNWGGKACHLDDARMDGDKRHGIVGGWHASSDVRKIMRILQPSLYGLVEMKRIVNPAWDSGAYSIVDEIKWGNKYIHQMQLDSGALVQHYYLWCDLKGWGEKANRYTNNTIGDSDDRLLEESTLFIDMASQSRFIKNQSTIYRLYKDIDPAYADKCLKAAVRCYGYFVKTWPVVTEYETKFNARPYMETVTDLMPLAYGARANLYMYLATGKSVYKKRAVDLADKLMALQETEYIAGQNEVKGFFYRDAKKDKIFDSLMAHGGIDGAEGAVVLLADLCDGLGAHSKYPQWKESLRSYLEDYLLVLSDKNAFGIVPAYLSRTNAAGGQTGSKMQRKVGGLYYQYLCDNRGANKVLARKAILLARGARILSNPKLRDAAWRQVGWISGNNPLNTSTVFGVGQNQPKLYKEWLAPRSDGMVVQGIGGGSKDMPYMRQGHWRWCEMELHNTAWFAQSIFELLTPAKTRSTINGDIKNNQEIVTGELRQWHKVTVAFGGPETSEQATPNPFTDYRLTVTFTAPTGRQYVAGGYYAADGDAANTGDDSGNQWRVHLAPDESGKWKWSASFRKGDNVAVSDKVGAGKSAGYMDGKSGTFTIKKSNKKGRDFRGKGRLQYVGKHHLQFAGSKEYFLKCGSDAPETFLAYKDFDGTVAKKKNVPLKTWQPHLKDWKNGDPTWKNGKGKGIIGAINYLSGKGANSISFLTYNAGGDGDNVWPFRERNDKFRYDCSKLDQWQIVFDHAQAKGVYLNFKTQETEMDDNRHGNKKKIVESLDGGDLGPERKLYYRELIARFGYSLALNWNLGEENSQTPAQQRAMTSYFKKNDPYNHLVVVHTFPNKQDEVYSRLLGDQSDLTGASLQNDWKQTHQKTLKWIKASADAGKPWVVANDEQGSADKGAVPDTGYKGFDPKTTGYSMHDIRKHVLWGNLMAGGAGVEYYFGYKLPANDLLCEDYRSRDKSWDYGQIALEFFNEQDIPFWEMVSKDDLTWQKNDYCFVKEGQIYLIYQKQGGDLILDLSKGDFDCSYFNPRTGKGAKALYGSIPFRVPARYKFKAPDSEDWLLVIRSKDGGKVTQTEKPDSNEK